MSGAARPPLVVLAAGLARRYGGCKPLAPIGPRGEAVIDLLASDALAAGFSSIVLVLHPETGPAVRYHVDHVWPGSVEVRFATQLAPLGTVHAVLAARDQLGGEEPFGVANADDVYGEPPMRMLADRLSSEAEEHLLVGFRLRSTVATSDPVTRGICEVDAEEHLVALHERRKVTRLDDARFAAGDGRDPAELDGEAVTSVNLWGFRPSIWGVLDKAMAESGLGDASTTKAPLDAPRAEVLLPEVVARAVTEGQGPPVRVLTTESRLVGVTHAADLPVVTAELARQVASGIRPPATFEGQRSPT